jgi:single-strand DNA-binding protein
MARGINKVILIGNLGQDPEVRSTASDQVVASLRVATSESWRDKASGERIERTEWHRISVWGRLAEICRDYLHKGSRVYIEGRLQTRKWQDKDGNDRYTTEIVASDMQMLDSRADGDGDSRRYGDSGRPEGRAPAAADTGNGSQPFDIDDDIPF